MEKERDVFVLHTTLGRGLQYRERKENRTADNKHTRCCRGSLDVTGVVGEDKERQTETQRCGETQRDAESTEKHNTNNG